MIKEQLVASIVTDRKVSKYFNKMLNSNDPAICPKQFDIVETSLRLIKLCFSIEWL